MKRFLLIFTFISIVIGLLFIGVYFATLPTVGSDLELISSRANLKRIKTSKVVCQDDVFLCEDGNYVSRDQANSCKFTCRSTTPTRPNPNAINFPADTKQCSDGSYVARDNNNGCQFKSCPIAKTDLQSSKSSAPVVCGAIDIDQNNKLDILDFQAFVGFYGRNCSDNFLASNGCGGKDTNLDGKVDQTDFNSYLKRFDKSTCVL